MERLEKTSLKSLINQMELIAKGYFDDRKKRGTEFLNDSDNLIYINHRERFIKRVENAYLELDPLEQLVINNDFFYEDYPNWWTDLFSKNSYQYLKRRAIIHFLNVFYED